MLSTPDCFECKHHLGDGKCKAFDNIPNDIFLQRTDHTVPYSNDKGYLFEIILESTSKFVSLILFSHDLFWVSID
jgi:hypothetical protein